MIAKSQVLDNKSGVVVDHNTKEPQVRPTNINS